MAEKSNQERLEAAIEKIKDADIKAKAKKVYESYKDKYLSAPAAKAYHCNWKGGLLEHTINVIKHCYELCKEDEQDEMIYLGLIHDLGKIRVYKFAFDTRTGMEKVEYDSDIDHTYHTIHMLANIDVKLSEEELNAIVYHHGGWSLKNEWIHPNRFAILLHAADMLSVRKEEKKK